MIKNTNWRLSHKCDPEYMLNEDEIYTMIAFIKNHEREDIPDDVWDLCMRFYDAVEN